MVRPSAEAGQFKRSGSSPRRAASSAVYMQADSGKFAVRQHPEYGWAVYSPDGELEELDTFTGAIEMLDIWIAEYRCKLMGRAKIAGAIARA